MARLLLMLILSCSQIASPAYDREQLSKEINEAPIIIRATVIEEDVSPPHAIRPWSGLTSVYQSVRYRVEEVLKGGAEAREVDVKHLLVPRSLTAEKEDVSLSHEIFRKGNSVILLLELKDDSSCRLKGEQPPCPKSFYATDTDFGAIPVTKENLELVKGILVARSAQ